MTSTHAAVAIVQASRLWAECMCGERHQAVAMAGRPLCDVCKHEGVGSPLAAMADMATRFGPWANLCVNHVQTAGVGGGRFGTGVGQMLIRRDGNLYFALDADGVEREVPMRTEVKPVSQMSVSEIEDMVGDGDLAEYL